MKLVSASDLHGAAGYAVYERGAFALKSLAGETLAEGGW